MHVDVVTKNENGEEVPVVTDGGYAKHRRSWRKDDRVTLSFATELSIIGLPKNL